MIEGARRRPRHECHAHGCTLVVPPRMLFCRRHWLSTRGLLQRAIWREYRNRQEIDKRPSIRYLSVQQLAIAELAFKPHDEVAAKDALPYVVRAEEYRRFAIERGLGDPFEGFDGDLPLMRDAVKYRVIDARVKAPAP